MSFIKIGTVRDILHLAACINSYPYTGHLFSDLD